MFEEYRRSLKMAEAEEILDLVLYRPVAFAIVKLVYRLPVTPNQLTLVSLAFGLLAGYTLALATTEDPGWFAWGALWYAVANVFDCSDGMLARLKKNGTPFGRLVDGIADWAVSASIFIGLAIGMHASAGMMMLSLVLVAGLFSAYHAIVFDKRQQQYINSVQGGEDFIDRELLRVEAEIRRPDAGRGGRLRKLGMRAYIAYMKMQQGGGVKDARRMSVPAELYRAYNRRIMRWWTWLGPSTNRTSLILAAALTRPDVYCWTVLVLFNLYLIGMRTWQDAIDRRLGVAHSEFLGDSPQEA